MATAAPATTAVTDNKPRPDFVQVQLTAAGIAQAKGSPLRFSGGRRSFVFAPGVPVEVERSYEWRTLLSRQTVPATGEPLFELVPEPVPASAKAAAKPAPDAPAADAK